MSKYYTLDFNLIFLLSGLTLAVVCRRVYLLSAAAFCCQSTLSRAEIVAALL